MNILSDFIGTEREQYANRDNNLFAFSLGQALRYYNFLLIIVDRYKRTSKKMVSTFNKSMKLIHAQPSGSNLMTDEQIRLMEEVSRLTTLVHLEIEGFYMFAKIFLDKIALFIQNYFGTVRGISLVSHNKLERNHEKFRLANDLTYPQDFSQSIIFLKKHICNYRDKQISHLYSQRIVKGTSWSVTKQMKISTGQIYPTGIENKVQSSYELPELIQAIDTYIQQLITLIESNRAKTRFALKEHINT